MNKKLIIIISLIFIVFFASIFSYRYLIENKIKSRIKNITVKSGTKNKISYEEIKFHGLIKINKVEILNSKISNDIYIFQSKKIVITPNNKKYLAVVKDISVSQSANLNMSNIGYNASAKNDLSIDIDLSTNEKTLFEFNIPDDIKFTSPYQKIDIKFKNKPPKFNFAIDKEGSLNSLDYKGHGFDIYESKTNSKIYSVSKNDLSIKTINKANRKIYNLKLDSKGNLNSKNQIISGFLFNKPYDIDADLQYVKASDEIPYAIKIENLNIKYPDANIFIRANINGISNNSIPKGYLDLEINNYKELVSSYYDNFILSLKSIPKGSKKTLPSFFSTSKQQSKKTKEKILYLLKEINASDSNFFSLKIEQRGLGLPVFNGLSIEELTHLWSSYSSKHMEHSTKK